jgi:hypothetical protein
VKNPPLLSLTNAHYHASREAFLDTVHRWFMFGVIASGAAAIISILPEDQPWLAPAFAAGAAILGALDLTFDLSNRARAHAMMRRRYLELLADFREGIRPFENVIACLDRYSAYEEPQYRVLFLSCWNRAQESVYGVDAQAFDITARALFMKNIFRRPGATYPVRRVSAGDGQSNS